MNSSNLSLHLLSKIVNLVTFSSASPSAIIGREVWQASRSKHKLANVLLLQRASGIELDNREI